MRRLCFIVAATLMALPGFKSHAQETATASVKISGTFYSFAAQNPENDSCCFSFQDGEYDMDTAESFSFNPAVTYTLTGKSESGNCFVYIDGTLVENTSSTTGEFLASVKFTEGCTVEIYEDTPYSGTVTINGNFTSFTAKNAEDGQAAFSFASDNYYKTSRTFTYIPGASYILEGENESGSFYVFLNCVEVKNTAENAGSFKAEVQFTPGCKLEIFEDTTYTGTVKIDGEFYTFVAQDPTDNREVFDFKWKTYDNETRNFTFNPEITYRLNGMNQSESFFVYLNGIQVKNNSDYANQFIADVNFTENCEVEIYTKTPYEASAKINGSFDSFSAKGVEVPSIKAFTFGQGDYEGGKMEFTFSPGLTYALQGKNEAKSYYVYLNGVRIANKAEAESGEFYAEVNFKSGDILEICDTCPYTASVTLTGDITGFAAQDMDNTVEDAFSFSEGEYDNETVEFEFSPGIEYILSGEARTGTFQVFLNGEKVENQAEEGMDGFFAAVYFKAGDKLEIKNVSDAGVDGIIDANPLEGRIFNLQGVEVKNSQLAPGIYIKNGRKHIVR